MIFFRLSIILLFIWATGCTTYTEERKSTDFEPIYTQIDFADEITNINGAIYKNNSSGFFASDRRAHEVGDILTVTLAESLSASKSTTNTTSKADTFGVTLPPVLFNQNAEISDPIVDTL